MNELHSTINKIIQNTIDNNESFRILFKQSDVNCLVPEGCQIINFDEECSNSFYNCASPYQGYNNPNVEENNEFDSLNTRITELNNSIASPAWKSELDQQMKSLQDELDDIEDKLNNNSTPSDPNKLKLPVLTITPPELPIISLESTDPEPTNFDQNELILQNSNCIPQIGCKNYMPTPSQPSCSPSPEPALCLEASPGYIITNGIVSPSPTSVQNQSSETNNQTSPKEEDEDNTTRNIIIGIVVTLIILLILGCVYFIYIKRKSKKISGNAPNTATANAPVTGTTPVSDHAPTKISNAASASTNVPTTASTTTNIPNTAPVIATNARATTNVPNTAPARVSGVQAPKRVKQVKIYKK